LILTADLGVAFTGAFFPLPFFLLLYDFFSPAS